MTLDRQEALPLAVNYFAVRFNDRSIDKSDRLPALPACLFQLDRLEAYPICLRHLRLILGNAQPEQAKDLFLAESEISWCSSFGKKVVK